MIDDLITELIAQYGLTAFVVYLFYRLMNNHLQKIEKTLIEIRDLLTKYLD